MKFVDDDDDDCQHLHRCQLSLCMSQYVKIQLLYRLFLPDFCLRSFIVTTMMMTTVCAVQKLPRADGRFAVV